MKGAKGRAKVDFERVVLITPQESGSNGREFLVLF